MTKSEAGKLGWVKTGVRLQQARQRRLVEVRKEYEANPKRCSFCQEGIPFERRANKFCDHSCSAKLTNSERAKQVCIFEGCSQVTKRGVKHCTTCVSLGRSSALGGIPFSEVTSETTRRKRLLKARAHRCEICQVSVWRGEPVPLVMDHIDGNALNNTEENLRLICRNCDGLLPTYVGRNRGRGRSERRLRYRKGPKSSLL